MQQVAEQCIVGVGVDIFRHFQVSSALVPDQSCYSFQIGNSARYILRSFDQCGVFRLTNAKEMTIFDLSLGHLLSAPRKGGWLAEQQMAIAEHTALCGEHCDVVLHPNEGFSKGFINILAILQCDVVLWPFVRDVMDRRVGRSVVGRQKRQQDIHGVADDDAVFRLR